MFPKCSENEHELDQENIEVMNLTGINVPMKQKLLQLQKVHDGLNASGALSPVVSSASVSENIHLKVSEIERGFQMPNLEVEILTGRNVAMKKSWLNLQKDTECQNGAAGVLPAKSSASLGENIDLNPSEFEHKLQQKKLEVKIEGERTVAMKHNLLKVQKATKGRNSATGLLLSKSLASLG